MIKINFQFNNPNFGEVFMIKNKTYDINHCWEGSFFGGEEEEGYRGGGKGSGVGWEVE